MSQWWVRLWYSRLSWPCFLLLPLSFLWGGFSICRRWFWLRRAKRISKIPVIVVGNLTVGGTGKTPLLSAMVEFLKAQGHRPAIISRGYGARIKKFPYEVQKTDDASQVGDEPLCLVRLTGCPVIIDPNRTRALKQVLNCKECTIVLSDDGLQHYALFRDIEIAVIDGQRLFGNGYCLPAGPLREPLSRLKTVDFKVLNVHQEVFDQKLRGVNEEAQWGMQRSSKFERQGLYTMTLRPLHWVNVATGEIRGLQDLKGREVYAIAGIGNPARFFQQVGALGYQVHSKSFPDHHSFRRSDFDQFPRNMPWVMTQKDAVKCELWGEANAWYLEVKVEVEPHFWENLSHRLSDEEKPS